ncbi:MAG: hypothetical protein H0Z28_07755 [Archaeoglobus sp.]|nr:hypothetical protein [Archaeoglobus sp.]
MKIEMELEEFFAIMKNTDAWERLMGFKFIEAELDNKAIVKVRRVASPSFYVSYPEKKLMVETTYNETRVGYVDIEEILEVDKKILEELKDRILKDECEVGEGRFFPTSEECVELFKRLMKTAR